LRKFVSRPPPTPPGALPERYNRLAAKPSADSSALAAQRIDLTHRRFEDPSVAPADAPRAEQLETFPNQYPGRHYTIEIVCPYSPSLCPLTGQPDFGTITYSYTPAALCVELKSLKLYLQRFRTQGVFYETLVNRLLDDFIGACQPRR